VQEIKILFSNFDTTPVDILPDEVQIRFETSRSLSF